jgi:ribosome biogenesis GTPase
MEMNLLNRYGWNSFWEEFYTRNKKQGLEYGRVISVKGFKYGLITETGEIESELSGRLLYSTEQADLPKVGDWVFYIPYGDLGYLVEVFPRVNELSRKSPGTKTEKQVIASNIDAALIVQGIDRDFNLMRLDRYIVQVMACNIMPIVILNKADLSENPGEYVKEIEKLNRNCAVYLCSTYLKKGLDAINDKVLEANKTYVLVGSSGVGKSSLLNSLADGIKQETTSVSNFTGKGRHTTTARELFMLSNGSLIIDTPGMREFGIAFDDEQHASDLFPTIDELAVNCRFADCKHINEAGCAVLDALSEGTLDTLIYQSYIKLTKEQKRFSATKQEMNRKGKQMGKMVREAKEFRRKYKY